jgi:hypothetical protein
MDNHRTSARWVKSAHPSSGKTGWLGLAVPCALVALGVAWEAPAMGWLGGAVLLVQALGHRRHVDDRALVERARASVEWISARLDHEQCSGSWGWKLEVPSPAGGEVWLLTSTGDFRDELPLQVEICDLGTDSLVIRHGDRLVLTVVESRRSGP